LALYLLGPPRLELGGEPIHIPRRKVIALLAYLTVTGRIHSRDSLATFLWPEFDYSSGRAELRRILSAVNRTLGGEWLTVGRETASLNQDATLWLDVSHFRDLVAACDTHGHPPMDACPSCLPLLEEATGLYRDDFMAGFTLRDSAPFDEWQLFHTEGLRRELASALERLVRGYAAQGDYETAIPSARRWLALDPLHEPAHRCLMALYARTGHQSAALRQYQLCEQMLAGELGLSPSEETTELYERIRSGVAAEREREAAAPPHNLPVQSTAFIGQEIGLADCDALLADPGVRLITVTGPGGMGKARLALEVATRRLETFPDGVWLVRLAPLDDGAAIPQAIASALRVPSQRGQSLEETVIDSLRLRQLLLLVDNCEHVLDGAAAMVGLALEQCPQITILATSREALRVPGEHLVPVSPLTLPEADASLSQLQQAEASRLFLDRCRGVRPGFELREADAAAISQICRQLDGMPLAIELAAARMRAFSPQEIAAWLDDRFRLLVHGSRTAVARQRTLLNTVAWSYGLLTEAEQTLTLLDESLDLGYQLEDDEQVSYTMFVLGLVAKARGEVGRARERFQESLALCREAGIEWVQVHVLPQLADLQAWDVAEELLDQALALSLKMEWPWMIGWAHLPRGDCALRRGELTRAKRSYEKALTQYLIGGSPIDLAEVYASLSWVTVLSGDYQEARVLLADCLACCRRLGLPTRIADATQRLGFLAWHEGSFEGAKRHLADSLGNRPTARAKLATRCGNSTEHGRRRPRRGRLCPGGGALPGKPRDGREAGRPVLEGNDPGQAG
jgi:DNA-binding SARP family transcriptional activator